MIEHWQGRAHAQMLADPAFEFLSAEYRRLMRDFDTAEERATAIVKNIPHIEQEDRHGR